jgi:amino acid transporter
MADILDVVAVLSAIGAGLGCASVGARMLFALGRDGLLRRELSAVSGSTGTPSLALALEMTLQLVAIVSFAIAGTPAIDVFFYLATMGILSLLVMYIVTNVGAFRYLFLSGRLRAPLWEIVFPVGGIAFAVYTLYKNIWPVPAYPFNIFPYIVAAWLGAGAAATVLVPGFGERVAGELRLRTGTDEDLPAAAPVPASV